MNRGEVELVRRFTHLASYVFLAAVEQRQPRFDASRELEPAFLPFGRSSVGAAQFVEPLALAPFSLCGGFLDATGEPFR